MEIYKYILEPYKGKNTRFICPNCGKRNQFTRYINTESNKYVSEIVGKCNRVNKCGYHYKPYDFYRENGFINNNIKPIVKHKTYHKMLKPDYISNETFIKTIENEYEDNFSSYLKKIFPHNKVNEVKELYKIGVFNKWGGNTTVFWQIDESNKIRTGKLIKYNPESGKRIKEPFPHTNWAHSVLKTKDFNLIQCFFGAHLVKQEKDKTIGIVESEKTAVIMALIIPDMIWLSSGGVEGINDYKVKILKDRNVIVYPDVSIDNVVYKKWNDKAKKYGFHISNLLENRATKHDREKGLDLVDFIIEELKQDKSKKSHNKENKQSENNDNTIIRKGYFTPSKARKIDVNYTIKPKHLSIKNQIFNDKDGNTIKIIETTDLGRCKSKGHNWDGLCIYCIYNCLHRIKINNKLIDRHLSHKELLLLQEHHTIMSIFF